MQSYSGLAKRFLLLATPAITSSLLATIPARAATFASSEAQFQINNFSINPEEVFTDLQNFTDAVNFSGQGQATADANSNALFSTVAGSSEQSEASNISKSIVTGKNGNYAAIAESFAINSGSNFLVPKGVTFSFDFNGFLKLTTSIDNPAVENATASGTIELAIFNESDDTLLDFILVESQIVTPGGEDFLNFTSSNNFSFTDVLLTNSFGGNQEFSQANLSGRYSRTFAEETSLSLLEFKSNRVTVTVPENSNGFILIIAGGIMLVFTKIRRNLILISIKQSK